MGNSHDKKEYFELLEDLRLKIEKLEKIVCEIPMGGMLSSKDFLELHVPKDLEDDYLKEHERMNWDKSVMFARVPIETYKDVVVPSMSQEKPRFLITPFDALNVTPFSYDLSIGDEAYSLRDKELRKLSLAYEIEPGETVIILTEENIALPPHYSATVWPRFNFVREGVFQSMVKIDPTWRGHLAVALVNLSPARYPIKRGNLFGTLIIYELTRSSKYHLCRPHNLDVIPIDLSQDLLKLHPEAELRDRLEDNSLSKLCEIKEFQGKYQLIIKQYDRNKLKFDQLRKLYLDDEWQRIIREAIQKVVDSKCKGMEALDLKTLTPILEGPRAGKRLEKKDLEGECREQDLEKIALEYGGGFKQIYGIPKLIMNRVEDELTPRIQAEVSADLFPKLVTLTLTVFGLLSLIGAIVSLLLRRFPAESPISKIDWPGTIAWIAVVLGGLSAVTLLFTLWGGIVTRFSEKKRLKRIEKEFQLLKDKIERS